MAELPTPPPTHAMRHPMRYQDRPPPLHTHPGAEFYCCEAGGYQFTERGTFTMRSGQVWLFPPGEAHTGGGARHGRSVGLVLNLTQEALVDPGEGEERRILAAACDLAVRRDYLLPLSRPGARAVRALLIKLVEEHRHKTPGFRCAIQAHLRRLLVALLRDGDCGPHLRPAVRPATGEERLAGILRHCRLHFRRPITVAEAAEMAGMSRSHFHLVFRRETGRTLVDWLNVLRVDAARDLLRETDRTVLDIALEVGFGSLSQFYHCFGKQVGMAPQAWREGRGQAG